MILLLGFMYLRAKQTFIGMAPMFCWQNQTCCFDHVLNRYVRAAYLDLSSSLPFFRSLHFH